MKELVVVRHGQADHHVRGLTGGWTHSHLTELGREQSLRTGERLAQMLEVPAALYASDLPRAAECAEIIAQVLGTQVCYDEGLREFNNGAAADVTWEQARAMQNPPTLPLIDYVPYPGAECWREMHQRVYAAMERIAQDPAEVVVVVTHTLSGTAVVHWWLNSGPDDWERFAFDFDPASITVLGSNFFKQRTILRLNDSAHLLGLEEEETRLPGFQQ